MGFFFRRSRAANSVVHGRISPNLELNQALMYIIITCKYEMNPIKNVRENVHGKLFLTGIDIRFNNVIAFIDFSNCLPLIDTAIIGKVN